MTNTNEILTVANTILDNKTTNEANIFLTMDYIYGNQYIFEPNTISSFANLFYSLYKDKPSYIYGLLNKIRVPESDFRKNIYNAYNIFSNENTNTMFIFYSYEDDKYTSYSYVVGDSEVKKSSLVSIDKLRNNLISFTNAPDANERTKALKTIESQMLSSDISKNASRVNTVYITGSYPNLFAIPFAYFNAFKNADVIKIRELKYVPMDVVNVGRANIKLNTQTNFYTSLESLAVG